MHSEGTFKAKDGLNLYEQWWLPESEVKGMVVIVHGLAEHCGRYAHVAACAKTNRGMVWAAMTSTDMAKATLPVRKR